MGDTLGCPQAEIEKYPVTQGGNLHAQPLTCNAVDNPRNQNGNNEGNKDGNPNLEKITES